MLFQVRSCPIKVRERKLILFFLQEVSLQQQRASLDSAFLHDIDNLLTAMLGNSGLFQLKGAWEAERFDASFGSRRLSKKQFTNFQPHVSLTLNY
jgi:hypothetical protein